MIIRKDQFIAFGMQTRSRISSDILDQLAKQGFHATYDSDARRLTTDDRLGQAVTMIFSEDRLPAQLVRPSGLAYRFSHDTAGRLASIIYPSSRELCFDWDGAGNLASITQPGLGTYAFTQDGHSHLCGLTYPDGRRYAFAVDQEGRLHSITDRSGATTRYVWDDTGELNALVDPLGQTTRFVRDAMQNFSEIQFADGSVQQFVFNPEENAALTLAPDGSTTRFHLNIDGFIEKITWPDENQTVFHYDGDGRLTRVQKASTDLVMVYDDRAQLMSERSTGGEVRYVYNPEERLTSLTTPFGDTIRFSYDVDGRLQAIQDWESRITSFEYNGDDLIARINFPNGVVEQREFDPCCRVCSSLLVAASGGPIGAQTYTYDDCGRMTGAAYQDSDGLLRATRFEYDAEDRIVTESPDSGVVRYQYDECGNMLEVAGIAMRFGAMHQPTAMGSSPIRYDGRGNIIELPSNTAPMSCRFGSDGLLQACQTAAGVVEFEYDGLGRRIAKRVGAATCRYGWAGHHLLWEESRSSATAAPIRRDYLFIPGTFVPIAFRENGSTYWLQTDARNAVIGALDSSG